MNFSRLLHAFSHGNVCLWFCLCVCVDAAPHVSIIQKNWILFVCFIVNTEKTKILLDHKLDVAKFLLDNVLNIFQPRFSQDLLVESAILKAHCAQDVVRNIISKISKFSSR